MCTSGFRFIDGICLRMRKSICLPNFDEISQFTAEIKLLPVSENGRPPFGILFPVSVLTYGSHLHVILHLSAKFRSNQSIVGGVMTLYLFFQDGRRQPYWI